MLQAVEAVCRRWTDWWSSLVQLAGTIFFNVNTFRALQTGLDATEYDRLVWTPDALGSICFLVSGELAFAAVAGIGLAHARLVDRGRESRRLRRLRDLGDRGYVVPSTGSALDLAAANSFTSLGALCFLVGSILLLPASAD